MMKSPYQGSDDPIRNRDSSGIDGSDVVPVLSEGRSKRFQMIVMMGLVAENYLDTLPCRRYSMPVTFGLPYFVTASSRSKVIMCARYLIVNSANY